MEFITYLFSEASFPTHTQHFSIIYTQLSGTYRAAHTRLYKCIFTQFLLYICILYVYNIGFFVLYISRGPARGIFFAAALFLCTWYFFRPSCIVSCALAATTTYIFWLLPTVKTITWLFVCECVCVLLLQYFFCRLS